jgi:glyoxylase-like metal-dependent hydrolase (beta-lactamase superfamily II)
VAKVTGAQVVAHPLDAPALPVPVDREVADGDRIAVGVVTLEVIHLRGHTPGSIALLYDGGGAGQHLFTGDSLFPGGVGNTEGDPIRFEQLYTDVSERIFDRLPDETWVYPGHGKDTTLGAERPSLPEWKARGW